jgi:hypothetical protein
MWGEVIVTCFKILFWHFPGETEENHKKSVRRSVELILVK